MPFCPQCGSKLQRVRRRMVDKLISFLVPVNRHRCLNTDCRWEGNLRASSKSGFFILYWLLLILAAILVGRYIVR